MTAPIFKVFTGAMVPYTASVDGVVRKFIKTTASSTVTDRKGHEFDVKALQKMGATAKGMTIFLNHSYEVPEDLFGTVVDADAHQSGFDKDNNAVWDLDYNVMVNEANPRAVQAWNAYENGVRMGVSVGVIVKEWAAKEGDPDVKRIMDVENLEASIVGIPANPRTWVAGAVKSIHAYDEEKRHEADGFATLSVGNPSLLEAVDDPVETHATWDSAYVNALPDSAFACPEERKYPHHDKSGSLDLPHLRAALSRVGDASNDQCGKAHLQAHAKSAGIGDSESKSAEPEEQNAAMCGAPCEGGTCKKPKGHDGAHSSAMQKGFAEELASAPVEDRTDEEPQDEDESESSAPIDPGNDDSLSGQEEAKSVTDDANTDVAEELSADSDPEASASGATQSAPDGEADEQPEASVVAGIDLLVNTYRTQVQDLTTQLSTAEKERDEAREAARIAMSIVERISALPLGRKASYAREIKSFRTDLSGVYGDDFLAFLERDHS